MGMNQTPASERVHISFFGRRNAGKSSIINAVTGQDLAIVSEVKGTTTDPVYKTMELLPLGPVMLIDTPGIDDEGELGALRIKKSYQVLNKTDIAVLIIDAAVGKSREDEALTARFQKKEIPYLIVYNKSDLLPQIPEPTEHEIWVSAANKTNIYALKEKIASLRPEDGNPKRIIGDLLSPLDTVVLVIPIDKAAPKGRLILPQQQTIRDILESGANCLISRDTELSGTLKKLGAPPKLVITDSQVFGKVAKEVPEEVLLTSFSILFARYKGNLAAATAGAAALHGLQDKDKVLICEGCTHHRQCDDIGTFKIPRWIKDFTSKDLEFEFTSGTGFPDDLTPYQLIVHCGGCMLNEREMKYRIQCAQDQNVPITNYGILIAYTQGILKRSVRLFPEICRLLP
ncbi:MAG: [FeFe] hydrogenase H-cluster maturation GTPase HydF [Blautia sp.]|jgi:[FeFe] hydrogenase H-cluster maturation GTPase HydF